jgi:PIN domain nuclease of toxin-antitoxin system
MNVLLDTHVWVWSQESPDQLGKRTTATLLDAENSLFISTISTLEIARLLALDRLRFAMDLQAWLTQSLRLLMATTTMVSHEVAMEAYRLPEPFHRDPADRVLVATARVHGMRLATADERLLDYLHVQTIDARS